MSARSAFIPTRNYTSAKKPWEPASFCREGLAFHSKGVRLVILDAHIKVWGLITLLSVSPAASEPSTDSAAHWEQASRWISQCKKHHSLCGTPLGTSFPLPTRLLHVQKPTHPTGNPRLRLVITAEEMAGIETPPPYAALSHRWESHVPLVLKKHTLVDFCKIDGIPAERLGQSMQDALRVVLGLGYAYLWIDSLCIIQEDHEDWHSRRPRWPTCMRVLSAQ
jgi:hypothetical protein